MDEVNIRLPAGDREDLQAQALEEGLPYQALIASAGIPSAVHRSGSPHRDVQMEDLTLAPLCPPHRIGAPGCANGRPDPGSSGSSAGMDWLDLAG